MKHASSNLKSLWCIFLFGLLFPLELMGQTPKSEWKQRSSASTNTPALEWVMERQSVTTDKDSGITNDANLRATETMNNPKYPLELFLRVITVSLETNKLAAGLPKLDI